MKIPVVKNEKMKQYLSLWTILLSSGLMTSCQGQNRSDEGVNKIVPGTITRNLIQDRNGTIWLATFEGLLKYDGHSFSNVTKKVSPGRFFSAREDRQGNIWLGSIGDGVYVYDGQSFQHFTTEDGLVDDRVTNIYQDNRGHIWLGTTGGLSRYDGESFQSYTTGQGLPNNDINSIIEDNTGKFWLGTRGSAAFYDGDSFSIITNERGEIFTNVRHLLKDSWGDIWLGGQDGLWRYDGKAFTNITTDFVGYIYEDKAGRIWTSSENPDKQGWELTRYDRSFPDRGNLKGTPVITEEGMFFGILEDAEGNIWVGKLDGVYRYDGLRFNDFKR